MKYIIVLCISAITLQLSAQNQHSLNYYLPQNVTYNPSIPTPSSVIGHNIGQWHVTHDKLVQYMEAIAKSSNRVTLSNRGNTFEDRPLLLLTITSPENHANIKNIQQTHINATEGETAGFSNRPVVVYQGFSIHGNEPSGSNAALLLTYYLAAAQGDAIDSWLQNTVILLDPALNPDGLQRFSYWANSNRNMHLNPDPNDREYSEVWPGGRTNHYWFDMNRDWLPVQLPESKARIETFHNWLPNILTDHHEMGTNSTFFFQPGIPSRTHPLTPQGNQKLTKQIASYHAKALDNIGSLYYSEESFDDFYYGKGSTFPDINGSIGILFEQASSRGHVQESENGLLTFPFTIRNQFITTLSTLEAANALRTDILKFQYNFFKNARKEAYKNGNKAIIFGDEKNAAKAYHLADILQRHRIKIHALKNDVNLNGSTYKKKYSYVVPKNQKNTRLITAMFEKRTTFKDSLFYDISAWTLPLAFNLDYTETTMANAGQSIAKVAPQAGTVSANSEYAYLFEWHEYYTPKLLQAILKKGLRIKFSVKQFTANGVDYDYGTILIPAQNQIIASDAIFKFLTTEAKAAHVNITAVSTGLNEGIDLGSRNFKTINPQKIALIVGNGITPYDAGEIWHLLDTRYNIPVTKLDTKSLSAVTLSKYTSIIMPNSYNGLNIVQTNALKTWVKNGGNLIAYRHSLKWLKNNNFIPLNFKTNSLTAKTISFENRQNFRGAQGIGGAIFNTRLDRSHPINYGIKNNTLPMFRNTTIFVSPNKNSYNNPITYTKAPLLSGYVSKQNLDSIAGTVPLQIARLDKGKVIAFTDNTNFRAFWYGTNKLLANALFFNSAF